MEQVNAHWCKEILFHREIRHSRHLEEFIIIKWLTHYLGLKIRELLLFYSFHIPPFALPWCCLFLEFLKFHSRRTSPAILHIEKNQHTGTNNSITICTIRENSFVMFYHCAYTSSGDLPLPLSPDLFITSIGSGQPSQHHSHHWLSFHVQSLPSSSEAYSSLRSPAGKGTNSHPLSSPLPWPVPLLSSPVWWQSCTYLPRSKLI